VTVLARRSGATALVTLLLGALAAGCGSSSHSTTQTHTTAATAVTSVSWDLPEGEPGSLDPALSGTSSSTEPLSNMCEALTRYSASGQLEPWLASSYKQVNPKTLVFTIRSGVKFWDGHPLTAADVVYSLSRQLNPHLGGTWTDPWFTDVASIKQTGANQVTVNFSSPDAVFVEIMSTTAGQISEASYVKAKGKEYGTSAGGLMCTGPYEFVKWTPGQSIVMKANPSYWNPSQAAKIKTLTFDFVTDPNTLTNALKSGQIDGTYEVPVGSVSTLKSSGAGRMQLARSVAMEILTFTQKSGPIRNADVRKALTIAIDRPEIAKSVYGGAAEPVWSINMPSLWSYGHSVFNPTYATLPGSSIEVSQAKSLVKAAGGSAGSTMTLLVSSANSTDQEIAAYLQSVASSIGLHIKIVTTAPSRFVQVLFDPKLLNTYDMLLDEGAWDILDPIEPLMFVAIPGSILNTSGFNNPQVTGLISEARGTSDLTKRAQLLDEATKIYQGQFFGEMLVANPALRLFENNAVTGAPTSPLGYLYTPWAAQLRPTG
jgi:peptide/nickel transport system substrate-binding protein